MGVGGRPLAPAALPLENNRYPFLGGWVDPRAYLDGCGKFDIHRDSILGQSSPQQVFCKTVTEFQLNFCFKGLISAFSARPSNDGHSYSYCELPTSNETQIVLAGQRKIAITMSYPCANVTTPNATKAVLKTSTHPSVTNYTHARRNSSERARHHHGL